MISMGCQSMFGCLSLLQLAPAPQSPVGRDVEDWERSWGGRRTSIAKPVFGCGPSLLAAEGGRRARGETIVEFHVTLGLQTLRCHGDVGGILWILRNKLYKTILGLASVAAVPGETHDKENIPRRRNQHEKTPKSRASDPSSQSPQQAAIATSKYNA
jgi:hypothetical protein